jgi:hypothetical protein
VTLARPSHDSPGRERGSVPCVTCGGPVPLTRFAIGKKHCTDRECVAVWRRARIHDEGLALILVPKVGQTWVKRGTADTTYGRSSGK